MNSENPKRPEFKLNEPTLKIRGGPSRSSVQVRRPASSLIARRERLNELLRAHDPEMARKWLSEIKPDDYQVLRQIATEGIATGVSPSLRKNAIDALAYHPTPENLNLLTELAVHGEDVYVRSHALFALSRAGLTLAMPILRDALAATDPLEAASAERALEMSAKKLGTDILVTEFINENRPSVLKRKDAVWNRLKARAKSPPDTKTPRKTTARSSRQRRP